MNTTITIPSGSSIIIEEPIIHLLSSLVIPLISITAVIVIGVLTWDYSKKQHERAIMKDIFAILGESPHKTPEECIRKNYKNGELENMKDTYDDGAISVVRRNYDQIGSMLASKLTPTTQYYQIFGVLTIVSYVILKGMIEEKRKEHKFHMAYFTNLAIDCFDFWDGQEEKVKPKIETPKGEKITRQMLGNKIIIPKKRRLPSLLSSRFCKQSQ